MKKTINKSISFIVPFFNEEQNLYQTFNTIKKLIRFYSLSNFEIILVNDCSTDKSEEISLDFKKKNKKTIYIRHKNNLGLGSTLKTGILASSKNYILWVPGDNEHNFRGLKPLLDQFILKDFDIVMPYVINKKSRSFLRRFISSSFTLFLNVIFFKNIKYFDGCSLYKRKIITSSVKKMKYTTMTFVAELLLRSLKKTQNIKVVGYKLNISRYNKKSSALKFNSIIKGIFYILKLRFEI